MAEHQLSTERASTTNRCNVLPYWYTRTWSLTSNVAQISQYKYAPFRKEIIEWVKDHVMRESTNHITPKPWWSYFVQLVLEFVNLSENGVLCAVSKEFQEAAEGDALWHRAYEKRFPNQSEESKQDVEGGPAAAGGGCGGTGDSGGVDGDATTAASPVMACRGGFSILGEAGGFKHRYNMRLQDPHVSVLGGTLTYLATRKIAQSAGKGFPHRNQDKGVRGSTAPFYPSRRVASLWKNSIVYWWCGEADLI